MDPDYKMPCRIARFDESRKVEFDGTDLLIVEGSERLTIEIELPNGQTIRAEVPHADHDTFLTAFETLTR